MHKSTDFELSVTNACLHMSKAIQYISRLVGVAHGEVWLGVVKHILELSIGLKFSLVVVGVVANLIRKQMSL